MKGIIPNVEVSSFHSLVVVIFEHGFLSVKNNNHLFMFL